MWSGFRPARSTGMGYANHAMTHIAVQESLKERSSTDGSRSRRTIRLREMKEIENFSIPMDEGFRCLHDSINQSFCPAACPIMHILIFPLLISFSYKSIPEAFLDPYRHSARSSRRAISTTRCCGPPG